MTTLKIPDVTASGALTNSDGNSWSAAILYADGSAVLADSVTELLTSIVGYYTPDASDEDGARAALDTRYDIAVEAADIRQTFAAFSSTQEGLFDPSTTDEDTLTALFSSRGNFVPSFTSWDHAVPLTLIDTDYAPYTDRVRPGGNIEWLNPATDLTLLRSLSEAGEFELWMASDS